MTQTINPVKNSSAETNTTGFYTLPGTGGAAALSNPSDGGAPNAGTDYARFTWSTASTAAGGGCQLGHATNTGVERIDVVAGQQYQVGVWVRASKAKTLQLQALAYNTSGAQVGSTASGTAVAVTAATWTRITVAITPGAGGVRLVLKVVDTDATRWSVGNTLDVDAVMAWPGATLPAYSDPSTNPLMGWQGTAFQSPAILFAPVITITTYTDPNPLPRAEVLVQDLPPGFVSVTRTADGRTMPVRGLIKAPSATGVTAIDGEIPFGVNVTYQVQLLDPTGASIGYVSAAPVVLDVQDTWVHQPLDIHLAAQVDLTDDSAQSLPRSVDGETVYPDGATVGVWIGAPRRGLEGLDLTIEPPDLAAADMLQQMLGGYDRNQVAVLCIRTPPGYTRMPRTLFLTVPKSAENDVNIRYGGTLTQLALTGDEVRPPAPGLLTALLRYADTDAFFGSYAAIDAYYGSYLARDRDYSKAGFAG